MKRHLIALAFAGIAATAASAGAAHPGADHVPMMVGHVLENGTPEQKARLTQIATSCFKDIAPIQQQLREGHHKVGKMLLEPAVDKASLEVLRARQMQAMDQMSRRVLQAATEAAEILTAEQRAKFNHGLHMMAMSHMHGH